MADEREERRRAAWQDSGRYAVAIGAWIGTSVLAIWSWFSLRGAMLGLYPTLRLPRNSYALVDQWAFVFLAVITLGVVIFVQWYYTHAVTLRELGKRVLRVAIPMVAILVLALLAQRIAG